MLNQVARTVWIFLLAIWDKSSFCISLFKYILICSTYLVVESHGSYLNYFYFDLQSITVANIIYLGRHDKVEQFADIVKIYCHSISILHCGKSIG